MNKNNYVFYLNQLTILLTLLMSVNNCEGFNFWEFLIGPSLDGSNQDSINSTTINQKSTEKIVKNFGYRLDTHLVASETGHILTLHRIPKGRKNPIENGENPIVLIHHGLLGCSDMWLLRGPQFDLPYILADSGYDVWLFNTRGNVHSRKHKFLNPDRDISYWNFGIEEMGYYDIPATIDYILNITNQKQIFFIGHSIGCSTAFIACSLRPEYNEKIRYLLALGPLANVKHELSPIHQMVFSMGSLLNRIVQSRNIYEVLPRRDYISKLIEMTCRDGSPLQKTCLMLIFTLVGEDFSEFNTASFPRFVQYYPAGTSARVMMDVVQYYTTGNFAKSDLGPLLNFLHYNATNPPNYDLSKVTIPVALYYGEGDFLVTEEDVDDLAKRLPNVIGKFRIPHKSFNHLDFILAINARRLLYENLINLMEKQR